MAAAAGFLLPASPRAQASAVTAAPHSWVELVAKTPAQLRGAPCQAQARSELRPGDWGWQLASLSPYLEVLFSPWQRWELSPAACR